VKNSAVVVHVVRTYSVAQCMVGRIVPVVGRIVPVVGRIVPVVGRIVPVHGKMEGLHLKLEDLIFLCYFIVIHNGVRLIL